MRKFTLLVLMAICLCLTPSKALTVDDLTGRYTEHVTGTQWWDYFEDYNWQAFDYSNFIEITKIDENTVNFHNIFGWETDLVGTVNWEDRTITIEPQNMNEYYVFCQYSWYEDNDNYIYPNDIPVIARFNEDGSQITLENYTLNYTYDDPVEGWSYDYVYINESVLTRDNILYTVKGTVTCEPSEDNMEPLYSGDATLTAYDTYYVLDNFMGGGNKLIFTVDETTNEISNVINGYIDESDGSGYWLYYLRGDEDDLFVYTTDGMSGFEGDQEKGELFFDYYYYNSWNDENPASYGFYNFTWEGGDGIKTVNNEVSDGQPQPVYNLQGIRVAESANELNKLPKGIYIVNGKKICVK